MKISDMKNRLKNIFKSAVYVLLLGLSTQVVAQTPSVVSQSDAAAERKQVLAQTEKLEGVVVDAATKNPLAGVQIRTADPRFTAMTDENGKFTIQLPDYIHTLFVTAPGYVTKEVSVYTGEKEKLIEVYAVVFENSYKQESTIFGLKRKRAMAADVSSFEPELQSTISVDAMIQNKMANQVLMNIHSGSPAAGSSMLIRGINSINGSTQPLVVVDGVITDNQYDKPSLHLGNFYSPLSTIDVNDIESISVLKDGTSLYGSKGGNGVILINTNRGRSMATKITVSGMLGYNARPQVMPTMDAGQYRVYLSDLLRDEAASKVLTDQLFLNDDPSYIHYNKFHNNTDWTDGIYRNGTTQSYNVSVNGGDEVALYNLSIGLTNALSTLTQNDFNRLNARFNSDIVLTDKLSTVFDISYLQSTRKLRNDGIAESYFGQINSPGYLSLIKAPFLNPYQYNIGTPDLTQKLEDYDFLQIANPYAVLRYGSGHSQQNNFNLSVVPRYEINDNWNVSTRFAYSLSNISENMYSPMYGVAPYVVIEDDVNSKNHVKTQFSRQSSILSDTRVNWKENYGNHNLEANGGIRFLINGYKMEYAEGHNTGSDQVREMSNSLQYKTVDGVDDPYKLLTYYGVVDYAFKDRYFAEAALNMETSSRFGNKTASGLNMFGVSWAIFPSINAAWLISAEDFMRDVNFINSLKLRAGVGMSGNDGIVSTASRTYFKAVQYSGSATGVEINNIANPAIQWETVTKMNVGLDASVLKDRLQLTVDYYNNTTNNLLTLKSMEPYGGMSNYWTNDGKLKNSGVEFGVNAHVVRTRDFNMNVGVTMSHFANKIVKLSDGDYVTSVYGAEILTAEGQAFGQLYGYQTKGVFATADEAAAANLKKVEHTGALTPFEAGDVWFVDQNNDNIIDEKDKVVIGNTSPDFYGTMFTGMKYKRFALNVLFNYSYGNDVYNYLRSQMESGSTFNNQSSAMNNRWLVEGQQTSVPRSVYGDPKDNNRFSDRWVEDGSYLRLKSVELAYDIPTGKISFLQGITVWGSATNLFTWTNYLGVDPEFAAGNNIFYRGIDTGLLPQSKSFNLGFKVYL